MDSIDFKDVDEWSPPASGALCIVDCGKHTPSGYTIATYEGSRGEWHDANTRERITSSVVAYFEI